MNQPGIKLYTPFPVSEPTDTETITRIKKLAGYVIRNGVQFEEMVRMREKENPLFSFLFGGDYSNYYKWTIFCLRQRYSAEQIAFVVENYHKQLSSIPPGQLDLTVEDHTVFYDLLSSNSGSKEKIRQIRKWIMDRAHSMVTISVVLYEFIRTSCTDFQQILHCVYVINDVLFHSGTAMLKGEYTSLLPEELNVKIPVFSCFSFRLAHILRHAYKFAGNEVEKEKLVKLVQLWESRGFIDSQYSSDLVKRMTDVIDPPEAPLPLISYPCPVTLPPPTPPVLPPPVVGTQGPPPPPFLFQQPPPPPPPPAGFMDPFPQHNMPPSNFNPILPMMMPPRLPPHPPGLPLPNTFMLGNMPLQVAPPLPLPPPPASALPVLDIQKTSVGYMANLVRAQLKMGHKPYVPIDVTCMSQVVQPFVEPGRLEARINEFYRRLKQKLDVLEPSESQLPVKSDYFHSAESDRGYWENNHSNGGRLNEEFSPRSQRGNRDSSSITPTATTAAPHVPISEDNMGHKLLRNLGWQQGYGLGAESSGRVDPITESAKKDRSGVGSGVDTIAFAGQEFSQYRNQQSAEYFTRIVERER